MTHQSQNTNKKTVPDTVQSATIWFESATIWFGSERSNDNAAQQLNEALAIHYNLGTTDWLYKLGRTTRGTLKVIGGAATTTLGVVVSKTGVGLPIGVPIAGFGVATIGEGLTQIGGFGEGENGYNVGRELARHTFGETGELVYNLTDVGVSLIGGGTAIRNAIYLRRFHMQYFYRQDGTKVYDVVDAVDPANRIVRRMYRKDEPWRLRMFGHSIEAVSAGQHVIEYIAD